MPKIQVQAEALFDILSTRNYVVIDDGDPCRHCGCAGHVSHQCEVCGRMACEGEALVRKQDAR